VSHLRFRPSAAIFEATFRTFVDPELVTNRQAIFEAIFRPFMDAKLVTKQSSIFNAVSPAIFESIFRPFFDTELDTKLRAIFIAVTGCSHLRSRLQTLRHTNPGTKFDRDVWLCVILRHLLFACQDLCEQLETRNAMEKMIKRRKV
jgi:hypothetical protein